ncbi:MAG: rRNA maturation RNase YbeY [Bacteroidia bacterium]|nr:rRNA maturation RNase YbeY [Bacteroidia bacterium]
MSVHFLEEDRKGSGFNRTVTKKWLHQVVKLEEKKPGVISYVFCSDEFLANINLRFLNRDYFTDVISFNYTKDDMISGDIMISIDRVKENAINMDVSYMNELRRVMVHGLLHLVGYDDTTEELKAVMSWKEDLYLSMAYKVFK